jgi:hypothetical protein
MSWKTIVMLTLVGFITIAGLLTIESARAQATIVPDMTGRWVADRGFIVTSPTGEKFACELGAWTPEFAPDEVSLVCVSFDDTAALRYKGHKDGELELIE